MQESLWWVDADGDAWQLSGAADGVDWLFGATGRFGMAAEITTALVPLSAGARVRTVRHPSRQASFPVLFRGSTELELRQVVREWHG